MPSSLPEIAYVDTIDACHLSCPSCLKGVRAIPNTGRKMPLPMFERIVAKLKVAGYRKISLYNWTEPFLNRNIEDYVAYVKASNLFCELSTTLSLSHIDNLEAALKAGIDRIVVSISGIHQETYQINHVGGTLYYVIDNLRRIRSLLDEHALVPEIVVRMIRFGYNAHEEGALRDFAKDLKFDFEIIDGSADPTSSARAQKVEAGYYEDLLAKSGPSNTPEADGKICPLLFDQIAINVNGDVYLCCAFPTMAPLRIGAYLELSDDEILLRRYAHPLCRVCHMPRRPALAGDGERIARAIGRRLSYEIADRDFELERAMFNHERQARPEVEARAEASIESMRLKLDASRAAEQALASHLTAEEQKRHEVETTAADLARQLGQQTARLVASEQRLAQMLASTSWKATGPLRSVVRAIRLK